MSYHYTESGLDNVYLGNGYTIHETKYGKGVSIQDTEGLHRVIGRWLVELPKPLNGAELRFLRLEMDLSQKALAGIIGSTEQNVRRWEKDRKKPIQGMADRFVRGLYSEYVGGDGGLRRLVDRLAELDQIDHATATLCKTGSDWEVSCAA
jgi:DNA-binding transcriptional regulator YiaG